MIDVLFDGLPRWVALVPLVLSWGLFIRNLVKTRRFLDTMRKEFNFLTWGIKMTWLLLVGSTYSIPDDPWLLLLIIWVVLDMRIDFFGKIMEQVKDGEKK